MVSDETVALQSESEQLLLICIASKWVKSVLLAVKFLVVTVSQSWNSRPSVCECVYGSKTNSITKG